MSVAQFDERLPLVIPVQFLVGDGTSWKTLTTGALAGQRIDDILLSNAGVAAHVVEFRMTIAAVNYQLCSVSVPAGAGYAGVAPVQLSTLIQPTNQGGWLIGYLQTLAARVTVVMGAAEALDVVAFGGAL
jgi:hypothetical protein